jgi:hypothetical protein
MGTIPCRGREEAIGLCSSFLAPLVVELVCWSFVFSGKQRNHKDGYIFITCSVTGAKQPHSIKREDGKGHEQWGSILHRSSAVSATNFGRRCWETAVTADAWIR